MNALLRRDTSPYKICSIEEFFFGLTAILTALFPQPRLLQGDVMQDKLFSKNKVTVFVISAVLFFCASLSARSATSDQPTPYKVGEWLPSDQATLEDWQTNIIRATKAKGDVPLIPVIQEFKDLIENDPQLFMLFTQMFQQIPTKPPYNEDPTKKTAGSRL